MTALSDIVDMAARIADCCEDGMLRALLNGTREYALLVEGETDYTEGKEGAAEWARLGDVLADSWERAVVRVESWLKWEGSAAVVTERHDDDSE